MASSNEVFVTDLFQKAVYRPPTASELAYYAERLESGFFTRGKVLFDLAQGQEFDGKIEAIAKLYWAVFDRAPDHGGLMYWNEVHRNGASLEAIAAIFARSPEFVGLYGSQTSDPDYVNILYENVLGRGPDAGGKDYWTGLLGQGVSRGAVLNGFAQSPELAGKLGNDVKAVVAYALLAKRMPTQAELDNAPAALDLLFAEAARAVPQDQLLPGLNWSTARFVESSLNDGSIPGEAIIKVEADTFKGSVGAKLGKVENVPKGLTASLTKISPTEARLVFEGKATEHGAAVSVGNVKVTFTGSDFTSGKTPEVAIKGDLKIDFVDFVATVAGSTLMASVSPSQSLVVDLVTDKIRHGTTFLTPEGGTLDQVKNVDFSNMAVSGSADKGKKSSAVSVSFVGDAGDNLYSASPLGDVINGGGGNDVLNLGAGVDTVVFPRAASGSLTINGFVPGAGGDVLKVSPFLSVVKTGNLKTVVDTNLPAAGLDWVNGDVLLVTGESGMAASDVAGLFGTFFKAPASARKAVVVTSDVSGDTSLWYVTNLSGTGANAIAADEVSLVGVLKGVNNLELAGFAAENFS